MTFISGTTGNDNLNGTNQNDILNGLAGDDIISGSNGDDILLGGSGFDILVGDAGNDITFAGNDNDLIVIADGIDTVFGGSGDDTLQFVTDANDINVTYTNTNLGTISDGSLFKDVESLNFYSGSGNDHLNVTAFTHAYIATGSGDDTIKSGNGDDILRGDTGNDFIDAGGGNDAIDLPNKGYGGGTGIDTVIGGSGDDTLYLNRFETEDNLTVNYTDINNGNISDGSQFSQIESLSITTGSGDDKIKIIVATASVSAGSGNDTIKSGTGNDNLTGGEGNNFINAGDGDDFIFSDLGVDTIIGGNGNDSLQLNRSTATDNLIVDYTDINNGTISDGSQFSQIESLDLTTGSGNDYVSSSDGDEYLFGEDGADTLSGNGGNDTLVGGTGNDSLTGGEGQDIFRFDFPTEGVDVLVDFNVNDDLIEILGFTFGGGLVEGNSLSAEQFVIGSGAVDSSDRFIYNDLNGELFFDVDGNGSTAQVQLATLNAGLNLTNENILI